MKKDIRFILENQCIQKAFYRHGLFYYFYIPVLLGFLGALLFTTIWADNRWQEVQSSFMTLEQQKRDRSEQLENYVNGIYAKPSLMEDTKTLFESTSEQDYTRLRGGEQRAFQYADRLAAR